MDMEKPKRLVLQDETVRELYLKSGNECAFPTCIERMINSEGVFIGHVCHIEGVMPKSERFRENQTNEEKRSFSNLIMLCQKHHTITNDVEKYTVNVMRKMKSDHESKYIDVVSLIQKSFIDITTKKVVKYTSQLENICKVLEWKNTPEEIIETSKDFNKLADTLKKAPPRVLQILTVIIKRGTQKHSHSEQIRLPHHDLVEALGEDESTVVKFVKLMIYYGFAEIEDRDELEEIVIQFGDWPIFSVLKEYCEKTGNELSDIIVDGRFDLLD